MCSVPATVPAMMISNVSSTSFLLQLSLLTDFEACGEIYSYDVIFNTTWQGKPTSRQSEKVQLKYNKCGLHIAKWCLPFASSNCS